MLYKYEEKSQFCCYNEQVTSNKLPPSPRKWHNNELVWVDVDAPDEVFRGLLVRASELDLLQRHKDAVVVLDRKGVEVYVVVVVLLAK